MKQLQINFTIPEQSRRLLDLGLPADSADCYYLREHTYKVKLIDVPRGHLFSFPNEPFDKLYMLNEAHIDKESGKVQFEWHRVYWRDGRTNLNGKCMFDRAYLESTEVIDRGDFYDWMKVNHPIRYKRENWEQSRSQKRIRLRNIS